MKKLTVLNKSIITALLSSTIGAGGATLLGKTVVTNLLKFIPGAGTIAGGAISAGTAGVITAALGEAYIGNYSLYGVNVNNDAYIKYRTEASQLLDELAVYFRDNAGEITVQ